MSLAQEIAQGNSPARPTYGYYRQPNGWITVSPATDMDELNYRRLGWEPLHAYGRFEMTSAYAADHPLETLFMFGGAGELCEQQIREQGLALNPPLVPVCRQRLTQHHKQHTAACFVGAGPVEFPQVAGMSDLGPFPCRFCGVEKPTTKARDQHERVMHQDERGEIRTGETLAAALIKGLKGSVPVPEPPASSAANTALDVLMEAGLTDRQKKALEGAGIRFATAP